MNESLIKDEIYQGDCIEKMKKLPDNSVDAIVTDPPYGWRFMGKAWDDADILAKNIQSRRPGETYVGKDGATRSTTNNKASMAAGKYDNGLEANKNFQLWTESWAREAFRVLKPGGHALVFCGPRTYHRMAAGVEDAGFEIRDCMQWLFGSGFPKSMDISKAIDKQAGAEREVVGQSPNWRPAKTKGGAGFDKDVGEGPTEMHVTAPATDAAKAWSGWGTALKPANEPIVVARKPIEKGLTVAENVLKWGTGGLNIDACRIGTEALTYESRLTHNANLNDDGWNKIGQDAKSKTVQGRWPANLLLDEVAAQMLDEQVGPTPTGGQPKNAAPEKSMFGISGANYRLYNDGRRASRFFYVAKASKRERGEGNVHPTVKPIKLMEYLIKLVTPPNGTVLDPFMGSGSTGVAAKRLGYKFIGIEMNPEYVQIAEKRIEAARA